MAISFKCPNCDQSYNIPDSQAGKEGRCRKCGGTITVPDKNNQPELAAVQQDDGDQEDFELPLAGFYRAVLLENWKIFFRRGGLAGFVFIVAMVCLKFFIGHSDFSFTLPGFRFQCPIGWIAIITAWGCLSWYYMEIICTTVMEIDQLPEVDIGDGFFDFVGTVIKSIYLFIVALTFAEMPFLIITGILQKAGITWAPLLYVILFGGVILFPMIILTISAAPEIWMVLRIDWLIKPIYKAFGAYLFVITLVFIAIVLQIKTQWYGDLDKPSELETGIHLVFNIFSVIVSIIAMRSIGLFARHYRCYFGW